MSQDMVRILIVDDEERLLRVLRLGLKPLGFDVATAESAEVALEHVFHNPVDIILTDVRLGGISGVEMIYELERLQISIPIIVMTAFADVDTAVKSLKHGAVDYIRKPFTIEELERVLRGVLSEHPYEKKDVLPSLDEGVAKMERDLILRALESSGQVKSKAAKLLKISERTLWYKIKKYNIQS